MSGGSDNPTFTVIMPVYNHAAYVTPAIESVLAQTHSDWELIVVDDGSTDDSWGRIAACAGRDERVIAVQQANAGPAAARNNALSRARGGWLTYIDSDDLWYPNALEAYAAFFGEHEDTRFVYGYRHRLNEDGTITELPGAFQDRPTGATELFGRMYLSHLCVCYRRELIDEHGPYDARLRSCEDYELYLRFSRTCRFDPLGLATGLRRRHETNLSIQTGYSRLLEAEVLRRFVDTLGGRDLLDPALVAGRLGSLYYKAGRQYFRQRFYRQAIAALETAKAFRPPFKARLLAAACRLLTPFGKVEPRELPDLS